MTGDTSRGEKVIPAFLSILMIGSVIAIGVGALAGSAVAQNEAPGADIQDYSTEYDRTSADAVVGDSDNQGVTNSSIQNALDDVGADSVVLVTENYTQSNDNTITISNDNVTLVSESGPTVTTIKNDGTVLTFTGSQAQSNVTVKGFNITSENGQGIYSGATLENLRLERNIISGSDTERMNAVQLNGGIYGGTFVENKFKNSTSAGMNLNYGKNIVIKNNVINSVRRGIFTYNLENVTIAANTIEDIPGGAGDGPGKGAPVAVAVAGNVSNITIEDNVIDKSEYGVVTYQYPEGSSEKNEDITIQNNSFANNSVHVYDSFSKDSALNLEDVDENNEFDVVATDTAETTVPVISGTIQGAVILAENGGTVDIAPGTYNESVSIGTPNVTLEGPNAGTPGYGDRSTEAVITQGVEISANEVSLDGFQITNNGGNGVRVADAPSNVTITNNRVANIAGGTAGNQKAFANGINLQFNNAFEKTSTGIEITNNEITNITTEDMDAYSNDAIGIQLLPRGNDIEDLRIEDNVISDIDPGDASNNGRAEARGISIDTQFFNTSKEKTKGDFGQATNLTIENNEIRNLSSEFSRAINLFEDKDGDTNTNDAIGPVNFTIAGNTVENVTSTPSDKPAEALFIGGYENLGEDHSVRNNNFLAVVENFEEDSQNGDTLNATSNWWGATNGPGGDLNGSGSAVVGSVSVDPAAVSLDDGSVNLTQDFVGVVKDSQNVTLNDTSDATFSFGSGSVPGELDGTLVLGINGTDYVFENVLDDGAINTSASGAEVDSGKNGTSIANTTPTGDTTITVVGNNSTTAVEDAGSVTLVHEAVGLSEGYNLKSVPQPAKLYTQDVDATNQWDPSDDTYESLSISQGGDVDSGTDLHRGLYVDAASNDARLGYSFATSEVPRPADVVMGNGWHLVGSNFDINSESGTRELDVDLRNVENVTTDGSPGVTAYDSGLSGDIAGSSDINEYDTYWVYVDGEQTRVIVAPNYDPNGR